MSEDKEKKVTPTWGYKGEESKVFNLQEGEGLPKGWSDSPAPKEPSKKQAQKKPVEDTPDDDSA